LDWQAASSSQKKQGHAEHSDASRELWPRGTSYFHAKGTLISMQTEFSPQAASAKDLLRLTSLPVRTPSLPAAPTAAATYTHLQQAPHIQMSVGASTGAAAPCAAAPLHAPHCCAPSPHLQPLASHGGHLSPAQEQSQNPQLKLSWRLQEACPPCC
jgi:hypothetical protein